MKEPQENKFLKFLFPLNIVYSWYTKKQGKKTKLDGIIIGLISTLPLLIIFAVIAGIIYIPKVVTNAQAMPTETLFPTAIPTETPLPTALVKVTPILPTETLTSPTEVIPQVTTDANITPLPSEISSNDATVTPSAPKETATDVANEIKLSSQCGVMEKYDSRILPISGKLMDIKGPNLYSFRGSNGKDYSIMLSGIKPLSNSSNQYKNYERFMRESIAANTTVFYYEDKKTVNGEDYYLGYLYDTKLTVSVNEYLLLQNWATLDNALGKACIDWFTSIK